MKLQWPLAVGFVSALVFAAAAASPDSVVAEVHDDGSLVIEGVRYTNPIPLKGALKKIEQRHRSIEIHIHGKPDIKFEAVGKAILLLQKAGCTESCMKVGFVTEPATP